MGWILWLYLKVDFMGILGDIFCMAFVRVFFIWIYWLLNPDMIMCGIGGAKEWLPNPCEIKTNIIMSYCVNIITSNEILKFISPIVYIFTFCSKFAYQIFFDHLTSLFKNAVHRGKFEENRWSH